MRVQTTVAWQVASAATSSQYLKGPLEAWDQVGLGAWNSHRERASPLHEGNAAPKPPVKS